MAKVVNYTPEMTAQILDLYNEVVTRPYDERKARVEEIASQLGKKPRSVVAKLSREGVYIPQEKVSKVTGEKPATKLELAETLVSMSPELEKVNPENVAKMNKTDIQAFLDAFTS